MLGTVMLMIVTATMRDWLWLDVPFPFTTPLNYDNHPRTRQRLQRNRSHHPFSTLSAKGGRKIFVIWCSTIHKKTTGMGMIDMICFGQRRWRIYGYGRLKMGLYFYPFSLFPPAERWHRLWFWEGYFPLYSVLSTQAHWGEEKKKEQNE